MDRASSGLPERYTKPPEVRPPTKLWETCAKIAQVTGTKPNRWLRYGVWPLERALIDFEELSKPDPITGHQAIKNKAAFLTSLITKHSKP